MPEISRFLGIIIAMRITNAKYTEGYKLYLHFSDGSEGEVNLEPELTGEIFEPLKDLSFLKCFLSIMKYIPLFGQTGQTLHQSFYMKS